MLVVVVTIFALLWLPHRGVLVYNTVAALTKSPAYMDLWFLMFAKTCIYINRLVVSQNITFYPKAVNTKSQAYLESYNRKFSHPLTCFSMLIPS